MSTDDHSHKDAAISFMRLVSSGKVREAYDRDSRVGKLDEAHAKGWAVASMKDDWNTIFAAPPRE